MNTVQVPAYQAGMDARFRVATRHSRMVRFLRIAVPGVVLFSLASILLTSIFNPFRMLLPKLPVDMDNLVVSGTKITMESPHLSGYTATDRRPYEVWAKTATQDVTDPDRVDLRTLRAKLLNADQSTVTLDAREGLMNNKDQSLDLHHDIFLQTSTGYEARLDQAFVDMGKGTVSSDSHVDVKLTNGTLSSDRLRITGGGDVIRFEGNVVMHLDNMNMGGAPDAVPAQAAPETRQRQRPRPPVPPRRALCPANPPTRNDIDDDGFVAPRFKKADRQHGGWIFHRRGAAAGRRRRRTERGAGRAQCDAGLFTKSRPADPDRGRHA